MNGRVRFVRSIYWLGAVLDGFCAVVLLWPTRILGRFQIEVPVADVAVRFPGYVAAALMAGWTVLLAWGAVRPIERRSTLLFTAIPVLAGLVAASVYLGTVTPAGFVRMVPMIAVQFCVLVLMITAWLVAGREARA